MNFFYLARLYGGSFSFRLLFYLNKIAFAFFLFKEEYMFPKSFKYIYKIQQMYRSFIEKKEA